MIKFERVKSIIKEEGLRFFLQKAWGRIAAPFKHLTVSAFKFKNYKFKSIEDLVDFSFNYSRGYFAPMQVKSEITSLLKFVKNFNPQVVMEIGTARGGNLLLFSKTLSTSSAVISLDLPQGDFGGGYPRWKIPLFKSFASPGQKISLVRQDSHTEEALLEIKNVLKNRKIDLLFIDGDHTYEGVKKDFELYGPLVRAGGIIAFHDVAIHQQESQCVVNKFWDELKEKYEYREFIESPEQGWAGIGLIIK